MKLGPFKFKVYECYEDDMDVGIVSRMRLFVGAPFFAAVANRGKKPRMAGVVTVDAASFDEDNEVTAIRWSDRNYDAHEGVKLLKDGAPFEVTPKYAQYEWAYRGWPIPEHLKAPQATE